MRIKVLISILCICLGTGPLFAQTSLYEFRYHFAPDTTEYRAFLLRNHDGTGFIRVNYTDHSDSSRVLVEMQLEENFDKDSTGKADTTTLIFEGKQPRVIIGKKDQDYQPDIFMLQKSDTSNYYDPIGVESYVQLSESNVWYHGTINRMQLLSRPDLTKEFMKQYFMEDEDFYVNLYKNTTRSINQTQSSVRLFLLVVANTKDGEIGKTCVVDKDAIRDTYQSIAEFLEIEFIPKEISGNDFSKANVEKAVKELRPSEKDIVVFYYSGHGFCDTLDNLLFPHLDLRDKKFQVPGPAYSLKMEDIYRDIKAKGAHLNLVFSDCCNSPIGSAPNKAPKKPSTRVSSLGWVKDNCAALFLGPGQHSLLMTAASKKEESSGNDLEGGIFTFNLRMTLEKYLGPQHANAAATWDRILSEAQVQTIKTAARGLCPLPDNPNKYRDCDQKPLFKIN